jgi:hypothetical protein
MSERKTDTGLIVVEEESDKPVGAVSSRSWRRGRVKSPPVNQEALEGLRKAARRKANKRARKARKVNR